MPTFGLSQGDADTHGAAQGWVHPHRHRKTSPASLTLFWGSFLAFLQGFFQGPIRLGATAQPSHVPLWKEGEKGK